MDEFDKEDFACQTWPPRDTTFDVQIFYPGEGGMFNSYKPPNKIHMMASLNFLKASYIETTSFMYLGKYPLEMANFMSFIGYMNRLSESCYFLSGTHMGVYYGL